MDLDKYGARLDAGVNNRVRGRVREVVGPVIRASIPSCGLHELVYVEQRDGRLLPTICVGFRDDLVVLMPLGVLRNIGPDSAAESTGRRLALRVGPGLKGRVLDGLGRPMDGLGALPDDESVEWDVHRRSPHPLRRPRIVEPLEFGIRAIDGLMTVGQGQRVGIFAAAGGGKSSLLGHIARGCNADTIVICLAGERSREVRDFIEESLGSGGLERSVLVCATSDQPAMVRRESAFVATAVAEYFRDQGERVLLLMDSVTRIARAQREIGLAAGEMPTRRGFPTSAFALIPALVERAGTSDKGSITGVYTVLVAGDDMDEPVADELKGALDGHIVLSRKLAHKGHWPAIDVLASQSRLMRRLVGPKHAESANYARTLLAAYNSHRDLIAMGAYQYGSDPMVDEAIELMPDLDSFLKQPLDEISDISETIDTLTDVLRL